VATPNYGYDKRQKELAKKRKKEEKLKNRAERKVGEGDDADSEGGTGSDDHTAANNESSAE